MLLYRTLQCYILVENSVETGMPKLYFGSFLCNHFSLEVVSSWCLNVAGEVRVWNESGLLCELSLVLRYIPPSVGPSPTDNTNSVMVVEIK